MAWRRINASPKLSALTWNSKCSASGSSESQKQIGSVTSSTNGSRGNRPDAAGKPAVSMTEGIGDPFKDAVPAANRQKKKTGARG